MEEVEILGETPNENLKNQVYSPVMKSMISLKTSLSTDPETLIPISA